MTADEMFAEAGFTKDEKRLPQTIFYSNGETDVILQLEFRRVTCWAPGMWPGYMSAAAVNATYHKCVELGWIK